MKICPPEPTPIIEKPSFQNKKWVISKLLINLALSTRQITIQGISAIKINCFIQWIVIYPVDSTIHPLNNWGLICYMMSCMLIMHRRHCVTHDCHACTSTYYYLKFMLWVIILMTFGTYPWGFFIFLVFSFGFDCCKFAAFHCCCFN